MFLHLAIRFRTTWGTTLPHNEVLWANDPSDSDYDGAESFLSLEFPAMVAKHLASQMRYAPRLMFAVKDILRQSKLPLLDASDSQVQKVIGKVKGGDRISPVLLLRGDFRKGWPLIIADGYHRVCAAYHLGDDTMVRCHITDIVSDDNK